MKNIILLLSILALHALHGCATSGEYRYQFEPSGMTPDFSLVDSRPEADKKAEIMSSNISSDQYGIYRLGDNQVIPDRMLYLESRLSENQRYFPAQTEIIVKHFVIYNNMQQIVKRNSAFGMFGALGVLAGAAAEKNESEASIITELELEINTRTYSSRVSMPYLIDKYNGVSKEEMGGTIKTSMDKAINEILLVLDKSHKT